MTGKHVLLALACACSVLAEIRVSALFSDHMVLQQNAPVRVWGTANPGEKVTVSFRFHSVSTSSTAGGRWEVTLPELQPGVAGEMAITGTNNILIRDVLVGEVWVASGQSNMAMAVNRANNAEQEAKDSENPEIRFFQVATAVSDEPLETLKGSWVAASPQTTPRFSATAYFFARELHRRYRIPFGIIQSAVGGTPAEAWTSLPVLREDPSLSPLLDKWRGLLVDLPSAMKRYEKQLKAWEQRGADQKAAPRPQEPPTPGHRWQPAGLFNGMIAPLIPYTIRGAIWYQGEHNAGRGEGGLYRHLLETLIRDWRDRWNQGDFPFLFVQLPNFIHKTNPEIWAEVQDAFRRALEMRNTGMAITIDIGDPNDIHPTNKQDAGTRLARVARKIAYGEDIVYSGPLYRGCTFEAGAIRVSFDQAGSGLKTKGGGAVKAFEVAGPDGKWVAAPARANGSTVVVETAGVGEPVLLRYAWGGNPETNLYNSEDLPASPFKVRLAGRQ